MAKRSVFAAVPLALFGGAALLLWLEQTPTGDPATELKRVGEALKPVPSKLPPVVGPTGESPLELQGPQVVRSAGLEGEELAKLLKRRLANEECQVCGEAIAPGATFLKSEDGSRWHEPCHKNSGSCGITGRPIPRGAAWVEVMGEAFLADAYGRAKTCAATGLPLENHGEYVINPRTQTHVLSSALKRTRRCVSCQDHLLSGIDVGGVGFSCSDCASSFKGGVEGKVAGLVADVGTFLKSEGLKVPPVEVFFASREDGLTGTERGLCQSSVSTSIAARVTRHRILVLSHLSQEVTQVVLCHEMTHAVIGEAGIRLEPGDEEGLCELAAWRFAKKRGFSEHVLKGIEENEVDTYREGFLRQQAKKGSLATLLSR